VNNISGQASKATTLAARPRGRGAAATNNKRRTTDSLKTMKTPLLCLSLLLAGALVALAEAEVGKPAPAFTGKDLDGKTHRLADFKDKIVILEAYNLDCPFCEHHYKNGAMQELQGYATSKGAVWLVVNSVNAKHSSYRTPEAAKKEWDAQKMKATAWIDDSSGELGKLYAMKTTPQMYVINAEGILVYQGAIDDKASSNHDPAQARNYVKEAVASLQAGKPIEVTQTKPYGCSVKY